MEADIYDFDHTLVPFDSGSLFVGYCLLHYPWVAFSLPVIAVGGLLKLTKRITFTQFKRICYSFLWMIPVERAVSGFWDKHEHEVFKWFKYRPRYSIVISASPDFLLEDICKRIGVDCLICTRHSKKTGRIIGKNCRRQEKVDRLYKEFDRDKIKIVDVYSDSLRSDRPIFSLATGKCYNIVSGRKLAFDYKELYNEF
ncbi:MAG: haloacid dehalogenase-like hydrolase [Clostridia bacterium]|nr:haloacid dehalogenase-like hydrolase [Clostridia bacterium]